MTTRTQLEKITSAIISLRPGAKFTLKNDSLEEIRRLNEHSNEIEFDIPSLDWTPEFYQKKPTKEEILAEIAKQDKEYAATEYQRLRQPEYPPLSDLADALYWQAQGDNTKMEQYLAAVNAVKEKYPKGVQ